MGACFIVGRQSHEYTYNAGRKAMNKILISAGLAAAASAAITLSACSTTHTSTPVAAATIKPAATHASPPRPGVNGYEPPMSASPTPSATPSPTLSPKPAAPAGPVTVIDMSGTGIENSSPVTINSGTLTATYSYDCSSFGSSGNFIADLETPDQGSLNSDDQSIANALGSGGTATTTIYPQNVGSQYYLSVNSECDWSVKIVSP
jgi:hypothetical protein